MNRFLKYLLLAAVVFAVVLNEPLKAYAQAQDPGFDAPLEDTAVVPMQNVFYNVLWGSLAGGIMMMGWATLDDSVDSSERYQVSYLIGKFLYGATLGAFTGLGAGVYLSLTGITFDPNQTMSPQAQIPLSAPLQNTPYVQISVDPSKNGSLPAKVQFTIPF